MIVAIVRKELLAVLRDGRLLAFSVFAVLTGFFLASVAEHRQVQHEKQAVGATAKEQWDTQGVKNPHAAAHFGIYCSTIGCGSRRNDGADTRRYGVLGWDQK